MSNAYVICYIPASFPLGVWSPRDGSSAIFDMLCTHLRRRFNAWDVTEWMLSWIWHWNLIWRREVETKLIKLCAPRASFVKGLIIHRAAKTLHSPGASWFLRSFWDTYWPTNFVHFIFLLFPHVSLRKVVERAALLNFKGETSLALLTASLMWIRKDVGR